jgi:hypothetical protein
MNLRCTRVLLNKKNKKLKVKPKTTAKINDNAVTPEDCRCTYTA